MLSHDELRALARSHVELVEVLAAGDEEAATELVRRHVELGAERAGALRGCSRLALRPLVNLRLK